MPNTLHAAGTPDAYNGIILTIHYENRAYGGFDIERLKQMKFIPGCRCL